MNTIETTFAVKLPEKYQKYGLTNNIKARLAYEYFHDLNLALHFMRQDPKTYFYFLKRCIARGNVSLFKKLFKSVTWTQQHNLAVKKLFVAANYYKRFSIMDFLYKNNKENLDFTHKEWITHYLYSFNDQAKHFILINELKNFEELKRIPMNVWSNLMVLFLNHEKMWYLYDNLFDIRNEIKNPMNIVEAANLFGLEYYGKK